MIPQGSKVDSKELMASLDGLPEEEKFKIFYMIKGIELMNEKEMAPAVLEAQEQKNDLS